PRNPENSPRVVIRGLVNPEVIAMKHRVRLVILGGVLLAGWIAVPSTPAAEEKATPEQLAFFEKSIRPVLVRECYTCHSANAEKVKGGLKLDSHEGLLKGGKTGPAIVPGNAKDSLLLQAIKHADEDLKMPPKKKLADDIIADFEKWIAMGAPDPRDGSATVKKGAIDIEQGRKFWAFQPPTKVALPTVKDSAWPRGAIDAFLLAALEAKGLKPVADADPRTLLRRLSFDLTGLPPTPGEIESFEQAASKNPQSALEAAVDRLL